VRATRFAAELTVTVEDNGAGLPEGFSLDTTTSLGLQIVRTLVETELDGRLTIAPRPGSGTRVVVDLPVKAVPPASSGRPEQSAAGAGGDRARPSGLDTGRIDTEQAAAG
jgi:K+-sensing histidine kinase KdpD